MSSSRLENVLTQIVEVLVDKPEDVRVYTETNKDGLVVFHVRAAQGEIGHLIGKKGRVAQAIRVILKSAARKERLPVGLAIKPEGDATQQTA